jgi:hypothetical protein
MFLSLSEEDQLVAGNAFLKRLASAANPGNPALGRREVIALIDAGKNLSDMLKLDVRNLLHAAGRAPALSTSLVLETENE